MWSHPQAVCMTYLQHLRFSLRLAWRLALMAAASLVHAVLPDVLTDYTRLELDVLRALLHAVGCR